MPDLKAIVQRMIDAGESEENIATVIRAQSGASVPRIGLGQARLEAGQRIDDSGEPPQPSALNSMLGHLAKPETLGDVAGLLIPSGYGAPIAAGAAKAGAAVKAIPIRRPLAGALDLGAAVLDNPIVGTISPRAGQAGKLIGAAADFIRPKAAQAAAPVAAEAAPVAEAVTKAAPYLPNKALQSAKDAFAAVGETPLKAEASNAMELIRRGKTPEEAISIVMKNRPGAVKAAAAPVQAVAEKPVEIAKALNAKPGNIKLTAEEVRVGMDLMARGKSPQEALGAVMAQRAFKGIPGVQNNATVASRVANRNKTGRWD